MSGARIGGARSTVCEVECWRSFNVTTRAKAMGDTNLEWCRGSGSRVGDLAYRSQPKSKSFALSFAAVRCYMNTLQRSGGPRLETALYCYPRCCVLQSHPATFAKSFAVLGYSASLTRQHVRHFVRRPHPV